MFNQNRFIVYNASAGSGKTFQIALQYLVKILGSSEHLYTYRLLGITFTNKAAEEMRKRIIHSLIEASKGNFTKIMEEVSEILRSRINIKDDEEYKKELISRSKQRLFEILHYYDEFQLMTIDKLMYKIIRTFTREMNLPSDVGVEIEYKEIVDNLIEKLINQVKTETLLSKFLIDMSKRKIDDEKTWDIKTDLANISSIIFDDNYFEEIKSLENKTLKDFQFLKEILFNKQNQLYKGLFSKYEKDLRKILNEYESFIDNYYRKKINKFLGNPKQFHKITKITEKKLENIYGDGIFFRSKFYDKNSLNKENELIRNFFIDFNNLQYDYQFYASLISNINSLSIFNEINKEILLFKEQNNKIFIHDFNKLISERILEDLSHDTPYIFMRLGEKYAHFFIDEFQDTSALQWANLIPLLKESLSKEFNKNEKGTTMIVGDAKQSIYRFRGGKPEQFIALSNPKDNSLEANPFAQITQKKVNNLNYNWRSKANIIRFNNDFFSSFSNYLSETYKNVYQTDKLIQNIPEGKDRDEGFVQIRFYRQRNSETAKKEDFTTLVLQNIKQAVKNGYTLDEICILVDKNKHGIEISKTLINNKINVISSESLLVGNASKVKLLLSILKFLVSGKTADLYEAVHFISKQKNLDISELYPKFFENSASKKQFFQKFKEWGYDLDYDLMLQFNLYDLLIYLIDVFQLTKTTIEYAYLQAFLEKAYEFQSLNEINIPAFLSEWNNIEEKFSINTPEKQDSVRIMSVHKSKGLEFPVVVYYTKGELFSSHDMQSNTWIQLPSEEYAGFKYLPIKIKALEKSPINTYKNVYEKVVNEKKFDNINRLYVALTRASEQLYIILPQISKKGKNITYSNLFKDFLVKKNYKIEENLYQYGNPIRSSFIKDFKTKGKNIKKLNYKLWHLRNKNYLKINTLNFDRWQQSKKDAIKYGLELHNILAQITTYKQWKEKKDKLLAVLSEDNKVKLEQLIEKLFTQPELNIYYSGDYKILNEQSILIPISKTSFIQKRPDRLLIKDKQVTIIDYKTGEKHSKHCQQLNEYAELLKEANYIVINKILIYFYKGNIEIEYC